MVIKVFTLFLLSSLDTIKDVSVTSSLSLESETGKVFVLPRRNNRGGVGGVGLKDEETVSIGKMERVILSTPDTEHRLVFSQDPQTSCLGS